MSESWPDLLKSLRLHHFLFVILGSATIWGAAHSVAEPGSTVKVLWGLVDALRQPALHLAAVHGGIDGAAEVVDDLHLVDGVGAAQAVDGHLEHGGAVHVIGERVAALALLVVVDARRGVVAVRGQAPARPVG